MTPFEVVVSFVGGINTLLLGLVVNWIWGMKTDFGKLASEVRSDHARHDERIKSLESRVA